jgi:hypothetical protein
MRIRCGRRSPGHGDFERLLPVLGVSPQGSRRSVAQNRPLTTGQDRGGSAIDRRRPRVANGIDTREDAVQPAGLQAAVDAVVADA